MEANQPQKQRDQYKRGHKDGSNWFKAYGLVVDRSGSPSVLQLERAASALLEVFIRNRNLEPELLKVVAEEARYRLLLLNSKQHSTDWVLGYVEGAKSIIGTEPEPSFIFVPPAFDDEGFVIMTHKSKAKSQL